MERNRHNFLSFWTNLSPFTPLTNRKIKIWKKKGKNPGGTIIAFDKWRTFLSFWTLFCPFTPLKKWRKKTTLGEVTILQMFTCTIHENHMMYGSWVQWTECYVILDHFLPFYPNNNTQKKLKKWKKCLDICHVTKNHDQMIIY